MRTNAFLSLHDRTGEKCICIYFLRSEGVIVYIGSTSRPHARVYSHTRSNKVFDDVSIMTCSEKEKLKLEGELIRKHLPLYNKLVPGEGAIYNPKKPTVAINENTDRLLTELVKHRKDTNSLVDNKVKVVADLIIKAYKKEVK